MEFNDAESVFKACEEDGLSDGAQLGRVRLISEQPPDDPEGETPDRVYEVTVAVPHGPNDLQQSQIDEIVEAHEGVQVDVSGQHEQRRVRFV